MAIFERINVNRIEKALFVGFGSGEEIAQLSSKLGRGALIYGIEINAMLVEASQNRLKDIPQKLVLQSARAESLPFESTSMDFVFCRIVLSEIPDWKRAVAEMVRVIRPHGRVVIVDFVSYNPDWLAVSGDAHPGLDPEMVADVLQAHGMQILQLDNAAGKGTIGSLHGERLWVETFFLEAIKEAQGTLNP